MDDILVHSRGVVENYHENRSIWQELNHFKETGQVLGKHRIFRQIKRAEEIRNMKISELFLLRENVIRRLFYNKALLKKQKDHPKTKDRIQAVKEAEFDMLEIKRLINL